MYNLLLNDLPLHGIKQGKEMIDLYKHVIASILSGALTICSCSEGGDVDRETPSMESVILSGIKKKADLVTTEVRVRRLAIYDSSKHEKVDFVDPRTWKYGERKCIVPVDVTIKYGYDLHDMAVEDIKLSDDSAAVVFLMPSPKIIDSGYDAQVDEKAIVKMSSGMRDKIGHEEVDEIMEKVYRSILKEDLYSFVGPDIENNARVIFSSIVRSVGMDGYDVIIQRKEDWAK